MAQAKASQDGRAVRQLLKEVSESNYNLRRIWAAPRTVAVAHEKCAKTRIKGYGQEPQITFSSMSTADAILHFALHDKRSKVVALNFANGTTVGGGYKTGAQAQEEDLCRRIPSLYTTLFEAQRAGLYPFGPATCDSKDRPAKFSDVLWTQDIAVARAGEAEGFALLPLEKQVSVSLVAAAAPNRRFAKTPELYDMGLMYNTVKSIFITPPMMQPETTTLILGAWGCGAFGGDPNDISELFCRAICKDKLGNLYKEVHFAIPAADPATDANTTVFREVLRRNGIAFKDIAT
jgi:uncharacterized protein (TIGR02452 family)